MKLLTVDTATKVSALALAENGNLVGEVFLHPGKSHSERLIPMLEHLLQVAAWRIEDLDLIGVVRGPGSFTGIRIGIATAQGLAHVLQLPVVGVLSLESLAWAGYGRAEEVIPILDARKNEWYTAVYRWQDPGGGVRGTITGSGQPAFACVSAPQAIQPERWLTELVSREGRFLFVGDGAGKYRRMIEQALGPRGIVLPEYISLPRGAYTVNAVWQKWLDQGAGDVIEPYYIRCSEAEVNWAKKQEEQGRNQG